VMQKSRAYPRYLLSLAHRLSAEIYRDGGESVEAGKEFQAALDFAKEAQAAESSNPRGYIAESEYWESVRDYPKALTARDKSEPYCVEYERRVELHQYRWRLEYWSGQYEAALRDLGALAKLRDQSDPMLVWYAGLFPSLIAADQGRFHDAIRLARQMAEAEPTNFRGVTSAASMLRVLGRREDADRLLEASSARLSFKPGATSEISDEWMHVAYALCRGQTPFSSLEALAPAQNADRTLWAVPQFLAAARALGAGDRKEALAHFQACEATFDWDDYCYAARVFVRKMELDPAWPPWIAGK
jgi:tetratricopeptide (TPR) repeat protein